MEVLPALNLHMREQLSSDDGVYKFFTPNELLKCRGIKQDFSFINICKVPLEVLKTEFFNTSRGTVQMFIYDKILQDRYYCIKVIEKQ